MKTAANDFFRVEPYQWYGPDVEVYLSRPLIDHWYPDHDVSCALPDLRYAVYAIIGAAVIAAALTIAAVKRLRRGK